MKKLFSILLVCTFAFSTVTFVGCGGKEEATTPEAGGAAEGGEAEGGEAEGGEAEGGEAEGGEEAATE
ncbi:MAG: hypothetical protein GY917_32045 [Planctomycetaceae bacterium]|nr:hypothetical protein [Planctomycetaceae bacterium]